MKRITVSLPDALAESLASEASRRGVSVAELMRRALADYFRIREPRTISFAGIARSGQHDVASQFEELLAAEGFPIGRRDPTNG